MYKFKKPILKNKPINDFPHLRAGGKDYGIGDTKGSETRGVTF